MTRDQKNEAIDQLVERLESNPNFYITDTSALTVEKVNNLRRKCFNSNINLLVVKNTLLRKAMEKASKNYEDLYGSLKGSTSIMFCESGSVPAKLIKEFRAAGNEKPVLKAAFVEETAYIGDSQLEFLAAIKSKNELIGDIVGLLQSPAKNVVSALQSGGGKLAGIVKTLADRNN